jgi:hypothetical protein
MTYADVTAAINSLIRSKTATNSISQGDVSDAAQNVLDFCTPQVADDYADDVDAAANGIDVGKPYHTSGVVKIRLA